MPIFVFINKYGAELGKVLTDSAYSAITEMAAKFGRILFAPYAYHQSF